MKILCVKRDCRIVTRNAYDQYKDTKSEQQLCYSTYLFGIKILRYVHFSEIIPQHALIQIGALGSTDWISSRKDLVNLWNTNKIIFQFPK